MSDKKDNFTRAMQKARLGFTIVELLVVVALIAMLASAAMALLSIERAKARDATREQLIKSLQTALNLYSGRMYPASSVLASGNCIPPLPQQQQPPQPPLSCSATISSCGELITSASQAGQKLVQDGSISEVTKDPINATPYQFYYSSNGLTYSISYCLETNSVPGKSAAGLYQATP